jgi:hypothetical protein
MKWLGLTAGSDWHFHASLGRQFIYEILQMTVWITVFIDE